MHKERRRVDITSVVRAQNKLIRARRALSENSGVPEVWRDLGIREINAVLRDLEEVTGKKA